MITPTTRRRYSEAFKQQVIKEIETKKYASAFAASKAYGINGSETIYKWIRKYGRNELVPQYIEIKSMDEINEKKELKKRVRELEKALADAHMARLLSESYLEIACENLDADLDDFKKKHVDALLKGPPKKARK